MKKGDAVSTKMGLGTLVENNGQFSTVELEDGRIVEMQTKDVSLFQTKEKVDAAAAALDEFARWFEQAGE